MSMMDYNHEQAQRNWNNNVIRQPMLPDTIHFHHTISNQNTEVMRITRDGVWVNPNMSVDETAKAVLSALDSQIKVLVQRAVVEEREACARVCDSFQARDVGMQPAECAGAIRNRGEQA